MEGDSAAWAAWKPARPARKTATAPWASSATPDADRPEEAAQFVKATQLDALAIAIGTSHGAYKFTPAPTGDDPGDRASRKSTAHSQHPPGDAWLSSVPQDLLAIINQYGGKMKQTHGVPVKEIQEAIKHGVRKINIDTDIRMAMTGAVRKFQFENRTSSTYASG